MISVRADSLATFITFYLANVKSKLRSRKIFASGMILSLECCAHKQVWSSLIQKTGWAFTQALVFCTTLEGHRCFLRTIHSSRVELVMRNIMCHLFTLRVLGLNSSLVKLRSKSQTWVILAIRHRASSEHNLDLFTKQLRVNAVFVPSISMLDYFASVCRFRKDK